jgi:hypothetical protein
VLKEVWIVFEEYPALGGGVREGETRIIGAVRGGGVSQGRRESGKVHSYLGFIGV